MIILGLDPGLATVGYGVVEKQGSEIQMLSYGTITTPSQASFSDRLLMISDDMTSLIQRHSPDEVAIEALFFNTNITTAIHVAQARGVLVLCAKQQGLSVSDYTPLQVKSAVCGYGQAEKHQVQYMVKKLLGLKSAPAPDDAADALAIAICHGHSNVLSSSKRKA